MNMMKSVLAYKGGHYERDLLNRLNIPSVNLEIYGCPKAERLFDELGWIETCGNHIPGRYQYKHCPKVEVEAYNCWLQKTCDMRNAKLLFMFTSTFLFNYSCYKSNLQCSKVIFNVQNIVNKILLIKSFSKTISSNTFSSWRHTKSFGAKIITSAKKLWREKRRWTGVALLLLCTLWLKHEIYRKHRLWHDNKY